jgi:uncharacterized protein
MTQVFSMKNKLMMAILLLAVASLVTVTLGTYLIAPAKAAETTADKRTLSVTGQAKVSASPDIAYISLGVISEDKDAKVAQKANAAAMEKVVASIKANGIKEEDIKTVNYSINPKYNYNQKDGTSTIVGYSVSNSVSVTVRDLAKTGNIIDAAADSGVNASSSISFGLSNYEKYYNDALKNAVLAAKKKAGTMAEALGVTLKAPLSISEGGGYSPLQNYTTYDLKAESIAAATPVQSGSLEITANVSAVYEY